MKQRNLLNFFLLIGITLLVALVVYEPGIEDVSTTPLTWLNREKITNIRIEKKGKQQITLQKQDDGYWQITAPYTISANQYRVGTLLQLADTPSHSSFSVHDHNPATFGLNSPEAQLTLNNSVLKFGGKDPLNGYRYVSVDDKIHLINDTSYYSVISEPTTFVNNALLPSDSNIEEITLPGLHLWHDAGRWNTRPASDEITADAITVFLDEWRHSQAMGIEPLDSTPQGEEIILRLTGQDSPLRFVITQRQPELKLARPDLKLQYIFPADKLIKLPVSDQNAGTP